MDDSVRLGPLMYEEVKIVKTFSDTLHVHGRVVYPMCNGMPTYTACLIYFLYPQGL